MSYRIIHGECIATLQQAKAESVHAIVCDPPYAIEFMGKGWDNPRMLGAATGVSGGFQGIPAGTPRPDMSKNDALLFQQWCTAWGEAAMRVLKPGGHLLAFGSPRTAHRLVAGLEDAGFEVRDTIMWLYGEGMPKSRDMAKAIDQVVGVVGEYGDAKSAAHEGWIKRGAFRAEGGHEGWQAPWMQDAEAVDRNARKYLPASDEAKRWDGWATQLKPMHEPICVLRKPNAPGTTKTGRVSKKPMTIAENLVKHGAGAMNVAACSLPDEKGGTRMPGNVIIDPIAAEQVDAEAHKAKNPSRFFYCPKAKPKEKTAGLPEGTKNPHPTVKPLALMEYLVRLVTPEGGVVLDPFMGSGTTGIAAVLGGFNFVGIEIDPDYLHTAGARIAHWAPDVPGSVVQGVLPADPEPETHEPNNAAVEPPVEMEPRFDIYCSQRECGIGIDLGRPATAEEMAMDWNCGPCAAKLAALQPA